MPLTIKPSSGSGSSTLISVAGTTTNDTLTLPAATGTVALTASPTFTGTMTTGAQSVGGNITFSAADAGIIFNKTGALTNSTLNDYEVGTWTPTSLTAGVTITSINAAAYTKIGRIVHAYTYVILNNTNGAGAFWNCGGLPFSNNNGYGPAMRYYGNGAFSGTTYVEGGQTYIIDQNGLTAGNTGYMLCAIYVHD